MERLWAPWRIEYIRGEKTDGCFLCAYFGSNRDPEHLVLARGPTCAVVMNRYPYTGGHLMICPYRHVSVMAELTHAEMLECMRWSALAVEILKKRIRPDGFNLGINLGDAGGAGLKDHLHLHVVPRWVGDTNFTSVIGDVRVIPQALEALWAELRPSFAAAEKDFTA
ncbi:MAG TPA: HIT domain-containing protein [Kiritimatiellia bacterium]|nr:HIT domain-containing protein [Kiritimatiellia bacterium]HMP34925.1 HIT domain-containing protein [Kiritimatiellia bacterium]